MAFKDASLGLRPAGHIQFHCFDDDDRVVDHQANRQDQAKERERVDGKTEHREKDEGAEKRDGNRRAGIRVVRKLAGK